MTTTTPGVASIDGAPAAPETLAGGGVGTIAATRKAPMLLVVAVRGAMYAAVRLSRRALG